MTRNYDNSVQLFLPAPSGFPVMMTALAVLILTALVGCSPDSPDSPDSPGTKVKVWTCVSGGDSINTPSVFYTGKAAPGSRVGAVSWTDSSGNLWLFGGQGRGAGADGHLNDLWKYSGGSWSFMAGSPTADSPGVYSCTAVPGARQHSVGWTDGSGDLWLFGGVGYDSAGALGYLNDLWKYSGGSWSFVTGSQTIGAHGVYSGTAVPGARTDGVGWTDSSGDLWLFGGTGYTSSGIIIGELNDLWKFSGGSWSFVSGSQALGALGVYSGTAFPGARQGSVVWKSRSGDIWLFGGIGCAESGPEGYLNDLWKYSNGSWSFVSGSKTTDTYGVYSGTAMPGARHESIGWMDGSGDLWLFGGLGLDGSGRYAYLNDLWKFSGGSWTWVSGSDTAFDTPGTYSGTAAPGPRAQSVGWTDNAGRWWLFGGGGLNCVGLLGGLNDLWKYGDQ